VALPAVVEAPAALEQSPEIQTQTSGPPGSEPAPAVMAQSLAEEVVIAEIVIAESVIVIESAAEVLAPDPAVPPPDAFGAGVEDPPQNPAET
jgi:hypothetical protein